MEKSNLIKQAKSDIFTELYPIINFYVKKGANPTSLKKYYRNSKRINDILDDIKHKGSNIITDDSEYKELVKNTLNDILDDMIAKTKDDEYKNKQNKNMKHIKEFNSYEPINESISGTITLFAIGFFLYKFLKSILSNYRIKKYNDETNRLNNILIINILRKLKDTSKIPVIELNDRYFIKLNVNNNSYDIRILKDEKILNISSIYGELSVDLSDGDYNNFLNLIKK